MSKHDVVFHCRSFLHSYRRKNKLELYNRVLENKDFCNIIISSFKAPFYNYAGLECLIEKSDGCKNCSENSFAKKAG